jgi:ubiquinone/menaquinone biosynthesis C-methylase UbiE
MIAPSAGEVIGIDPNETMLAAAREEAEAAGVDNVTSWVGSSFDLSIVEGRFSW